MTTEIAVATVSGKAYYRLVNELKGRKLAFLSLIPGDSIPSSIKAAITTDEERTLVDYPTVLVYDPETDPSETIDEAVRVIQKKKVYEEVAIGVDPGKTFGIAVLGDGKVLKSEEKTTLEMAIDSVLTELKKNPAKVQRVKIGDGMPELAEEIASRLLSGRIQVFLRLCLRACPQAMLAFRRRRAGLCRLFWVRPRASS